VSDYKHNETTNTHVLQLAAESVLICPLSKSRPCVLSVFVHRGFPIDTKSVCLQKSGISAMLM